MASWNHKMTQGLNVMDGGGVASSRGTLILAVATDHGTYLAADSRSTNPKSDAAQKIFQCGGGAFISVCGDIVLKAAVPDAEGKLVHGVLDLTKSLDLISSAYGGDNSDLVQYVATEVFAPLSEFWQQCVL